MAKKDNELLDLLVSRKKLGKQFSKDWRKDVKKWIKDYEIESFEDLDHEDLYNRIQIPYVFSTVESGLPTIFERMPSLIMSQGGKLDREFTRWVEHVWRYVKKKVRLEDVIEDAGIMFLITGLGSVKYSWKLRTETVEDEVQEPLVDPDTGQPVIDPETGQPAMQTVINEVEVPVEDRPQVEMFSYDKIFFSPDSTFVMDDIENKIPWVICEKTMSKDRVEYIFDTKLSDASITKMSPDHLGLEGTNDDEPLKGYPAADVDKVKVSYFYGTLPKDQGPEDWHPDNVYVAVFADGDILEEPERVDKKPIILAGNYGHPVDFHRFGEPKVLRDLEQDVSLGRSILMDYRDRMHTKIAIPHGVDVDEQALKSPKKFTLVRFMGNQYPQYVNPPPIPDAIMMAMSQSRSDIQMASAQLDLSRGGTSSVVDTATGQKIFEQATEKRMARKRKKLGKMIRHIAKNILEMCAYNWDIEKFAEITDMNPEEITQKGFIESLKRLGEEYDIDVKVEDVTFNQEARRAQAIAMFDKMANHPMIDQGELIKEAFSVGFNVEDVERFVKEEVTPEEMLQALGKMVEMQMITPEIAQEMAQVIQQQMMQEQANQPGAGRPATQNPVDIAQKAAPGSDGTQISAQNQAAYKQQGVPKTQNAAS